MLVQVVLFHSFLWLPNIPSYVCIVFFIHSAIDEHLGYFHILATLNSAAMNTGGHVSFQIVVFLELTIFVNSLLSFVKVEINDVGRICRLTEELNTVFQKPIRKPSLQKIVMGQIVLPPHPQKSIC